MLRRRLFFMLGPWVAAIFSIGVVVAVLLHSVLMDLVHVSGDLQSEAHFDLMLVERATDIELALGTTVAANTLTRQAILARVEMFRQAFNAPEIERNSIDAMAIERSRINSVLDRLQMVLIMSSSNFNTHNPQATLRDARAIAVELRQDIHTYGARAQQHISRDQTATLRTLRVIVLGFIIGFILLINVSIVLFLRAVSYVVAPVEALVEATHMLPVHTHDVHVEDAREDEFGVLARSFNHMTHELELNEHRKLETLHQVACTLSHELNNAINIVELQLELLSRQTTRGEHRGDPIIRAREALAKMGHAVNSLQHIRRIVLTEYVPGVAMLDLEQSAQEQKVKPKVTVSTPSKPIKNS